MNLILIILLLRGILDVYFYDSEKIKVIKVKSYLMWLRAYNDI